MIARNDVITIVQYACWAISILQHFWRVCVCVGRMRRHHVYIGPIRAVW